MLQHPRHVAGAAGQDLALRHQRFAILVAGDRRVRHGDGIAEQDVGLVAVLGDGVALGPLHAAIPQRVEADGGRDRRLDLALAGLDPRRPEPQPAVRPLPAEQRPDDECLARLQPKRFALELAFGKLQHLLEEGKSVACRIMVEPDAVLALQIRDVPFAGIAHMRPGDDLALDHRLGIGECPVRRRSGRRRPRLLLRLYSRSCSW